MNAIITVNDLQIHQGEPRVLDLRLAEALGYERPRKIRDIIKSNIDELARHGEMVALVGGVDAATSGGIEGLPRSGASLPRSGANPNGGRPATEYLLTEGQALVVCLLARTERAADVRYQVISVFLAWRKGTLPPVRPLPDILDDNSPLAAKIAAVRAAERLGGRMSGIRMWSALGLPEVGLDERMGALVERADLLADAKTCLRHLLDFRTASNEPVRDLIDRAINEDDEDARLQLKACGVRIVNDLDGEDGFIVASSAFGAAAVYRGTRWRDGKWTASIARLAGATRTGPMKFDGHRASRGVFVPITVLDESAGMAEAA